VEIAYNLIFLSCSYLALPRNVKGQCLEKFVEFEFGVTEMCFLPWVSVHGYPGCQRAFSFRGEAAIVSDEVLIEDLDRSQLQLRYGNENPLVSRVDQGIT